MNDMGKHCSKCKEWKPFDCFSPDKKMKSGRKSNCKQCTKDYAKAKYHADIETSRAKGRAAAALRYQRHPEIVLQQNKGWRDRNPEKQKDMKRKYYETNRETVLEKSAQWRKENPERYKAQMKAYLPTRRRQYSENPEHFREQARRWVRQNPEKAHEMYKRRWEQKRTQEQERTRRWREANQEWLREYGRIYREANLDIRREWRRNNKAKLTEYKLKRRGRLAENGGSFTQAEWIALCEQFGNRCLCCKRKTALTPDHVIPVSKGGCNDIKNIQPLCGSCNSSKGAKTIDYRQNRV